MTEIAKYEGATVDSKLAGMSGSREVFHASFDTSTPEGKVALFNAMSDAEPLSDHLNETIPLRHFAAQIVEFTDENGEKSEGIRIILVDDKGKAYAALSDGLLRAIQNILNIFGDPSTWDDPINVVATEERGRSGFRYMTLKPAK